MSKVESVKRLILSCSGLVVSIYLMSGCASLGINMGGSSKSNPQGWNSSQKREFENILAKDKYASLCGLEGLYKKYKSTRDTKILTKLLISYSNNLENSCIDIPAYKTLQRQNKIINSPQVIHSIQKVWGLLA